MNALFGQEMRVLWLGGRVPMLLTLFSALLGVLAFLFATNGELQLIPPKESLVMMAQVSLAFAVLLCIIIGADSISGERERGSLEPLLLTPASRRSILATKFAAALTPWPAVALIATAFFWALAPDVGSFLAILGWFLLLGTALAVGFTGIAVWISMRVGSNRNSLGISLGVFLIALIPTQLPGTAQTGSFGVWLKTINPAEATSHLLSKLTVNNRAPAEVAEFFAAPLALAALGLLLVLWRRNPVIALRGGAE